MNSQERAFVEGVWDELSYGVTNITIGDIEGLVNIIRRLEELLITQCPTCKGSGVVPYLAAEDDVEQEPCPICGV